jgi:hypothetical protein
MQANWDSGTGSCVLLYLPHAAGCYANTTACVHSMMYCLISGTCCLYLLQLAASQPHYSYGEQNTAAQRRYNTSLQRHS